MIILVGIGIFVWLALIILGISLCMAAKRGDAQIDGDK